MDENTTNENIINDENTNNENIKNDENITNENTTNENTTNENTTNENIKNDENIKQNSAESNKINVMESIKTNYLSWIVVILCIITVSYPSVNAGLITFSIIFISSYFLHLVSHYVKNIFTILHHYHHDNNNFFSHFSQILLELSLSYSVFTLHYISENYLGYNFIDIWTGLSYVLFYSSVHNYNYGQLRVNDVHYLHHQNILTNIGPDICDIAFGTKHPDNKEVENTNHYIPNVILSTIFILFVKYLCINENIKIHLLNLYFISIALIMLFLVVSSVYLYVNC